MSKKACRKNAPQKEVRVLLLKDDDTEYGLVTKKLGNGQFSVRLNMQNREVIGRLCGKFRHGPAKKNNLVDVNTVVLVGLRDFQDSKVDIIHVYNAIEARQLRKIGEFVEESIRAETEDPEEPVEDLPFNFDDL